MRADLLLRNATVLTMDPERPRARCVAVVGDRIAAVGGDEVAADARARVEVDLQGRALLPGFNDAHNHMVFFGMSLAEVPLHSPPVASVADIVERVAERAAQTPPGGWVVGAGYDQNKLAERRHPTRHELDRVAPDHHVWLRHTSGHMCVVGTKVLDVIGIDAVAVPPGGVVVRDETGSPTGLLQEQAQALVKDLVMPYSVEALVDAIARASDRYLSEGLTSCQEAGVGAGLVGSSGLELAAYQEARRRGALRVRTTLMVAGEALHPVAHHPDDPDGLTLDLGIRSGLGDEWLRVGPTKIFADGSLIGRTAAMRADFANDPGNAGYFQMEPDRLRHLIVGAHLAGWQVATHAIGDRAVGEVLDCYEEALRLAPRPDHRHRIEHCGVLTDDDLDRLARLEVIPVPQGRFVSELGDGMLEALGPERARGCYRQRSFVERGVPLPGSSDRPVVQGAPLLGLHDLVNQRTAGGRPFNPEEALSVEQALRAYTWGSAYAAREEHRKGTAEAGKLADLVVLSDDPTAVDPEGIAGIEVLATMVGGAFAFDGAGLAP